MDLIETNDHYVLRADLPGLSQEDVHIELEANVLTVSGEREAEHEQREEGYYRVERAFGAFARSLTLPAGVDPDAIQASFDRGVLEIRIPKPEERKPRKVTITAGAEPKTITETATTVESETTAQPGGRERLTGKHPITSTQIRRAGRGRWACPGSAAAPTAITAQYGLGSGLIARPSPIRPSPSTAR